MDYGNCQPTLPLPKLIVNFSLGEGLRNALLAETIIPGLLELVMLSAHY